MNVLTKSLLILLLSAGVFSDLPVIPTTAPTNNPTETTPSATETTLSATETTPSLTETPSTVPTETTASHSTEAPTTKFVTTTDSPVTTNVPVTTQAPKPTPPTAQEGSWNVSCIRAEMKILFTIPVAGNNSYIALSPNATADQSNCSLSNTTQMLVLTDSGYTFTMVFEESDKKVSIINMTLEYAITAEETGFVYNDTKHYTVHVGNSYQCKNKELVSLNNVTMEIMDIRIQAFKEKPDENFGTAEECAADDKINDAVPIAVACALAALIIVVLIAYLVGRRRSRQRGYQSV